MGFCLSCCRGKKEEEEPLLRESSEDEILPSETESNYTEIVKDTADNLLSSRSKLPVMTIEDAKLSQKRRTSNVVISSVKKLPTVSKVLGDPVRMLRSGLSASEYSQTLENIKNINNALRESTIENVGELIIPFCPE